MPAKNLFHDAVVRALIADGWVITNDPLTVSFGGRDLFVDLAAEQITIGAERAGRKIAVEVQSFLSPSPVHDLHAAVGQYDVYRAVLSEIDPDRILYLAVSREVYERVLADRFGQFIVSSLRIKLLVFDETNERVVQWIE